MALPKLSSLAEKPPRPMEVAAPSGPPPPRYPSIYSISLEQLPDLDIYDAGDDVVLIIRAHVTRKEELTRDDGEGKRTEFGLELREGTVMDTGEFKTMRETGMSRDQVKRAK